jgi:hypothetical protein
MAEVGGLPGLSQLLAWPTDHLTEAADNWETVGARCYELASQVWQDALTIEWQGEAADALGADTHGEMAPEAPAPVEPLPAAPKPAPLPEGGEGPGIVGGPGTPIGPTFAPPPHYHGPNVIGDPAIDPWDFDHHWE